MNTLSNEVSNSKNLDELLEILNEANSIDEGLLCDLPKFGGTTPRDEFICDCFSWDEKRALIQNTCTGPSFQIVERTEEFAA